MKKVKTLCKDCVRYHPKGVGNCIWAKEWRSLEHKRGYKLVVVECPAFLAPKEVFPVPELEVAEEEKVEEDESLGE